MEVYHAVVVDDVLSEEIGYSPSQTLDQGLPRARIPQTCHFTQVDQGTAVVPHKVDKLVPHGTSLNVVVTDVSNELDLLVGEVFADDDFAGGVTACKDRGGEDFGRREVFNDFKDLVVVAVPQQHFGAENTLLGHGILGVGGCDHPDSSPLLVRDSDHNCYILEVSPGEAECPVKWVHPHTEILQIHIGHLELLPSKKTSPLFKILEELSFKVLHVDLLLSHNLDVRPQGGEYLHDCVLDGDVSEGDWVEFSLHACLQGVPLVDGLDDVAGSEGEVGDDVHEPVQLHLKMVVICLQRRVSKYLGGCLMNSWIDLLCLLEAEDFQRHPD